MMFMSRLLGEMIPYTNFQNLNLDWILAQVDNLAVRVEGLEDGLRDQIESIVDSVLNDFKADVQKQLDSGFADINKEFAELVKNINTRFDEQDANIKANNDWTVEQINAVKQDFMDFTLNVNNRLATLQRNIDAVWSGLEEYKHGVNEMIRLEINNLYAYIDEYIQTFDKLSVVNPITGTYEDIQNVLDMFAEYLGQGAALTAKEYDSMQLTAVEYDTMRITALNYSVRGLWIFYPRIYLRMLSPFTGRMDDYSNIIYKLADLHRDTYTAEEYDALQLTAEDYDANVISAYNYDWNGKKLLFIPDSKNGITSRDYDNLKLTAEDYDNKKLTAYLYDYAGNILLKEDNNGTDN